MSFRGLRGAKSSSRWMPDKAEPSSFAKFYIANRLQKASNTTEKRDSSLSFPTSVSRYLGSVVRTWAFCSLRLWCSASSLPGVQVLILDHTGPPRGEESLARWSNPPLVSIHSYKREIRVLQFCYADESDNSGFANPSELLSGVALTSVRSFQRLSWAVVESWCKGPVPTSAWWPAHAP